MLVFFLNNTVKILDTFEEKGKAILKYLIKTHKQRNLKINYFVFEGVFNVAKTTYEDSVVLHDCVSESLSIENFKTKLKAVTNDGIIVIDSLSNAIILYGFFSVYKILHEIINGKFIFLRFNFIYTIFFKDNNKQLIAILHLDVLEEPEKTIKCLEQLPTCCLKLIPKTENYNRRITYIYKKIGGKIIRDVNKNYVIESILVYLICRAKNFDLRMII